MHMRRLLASAVLLSLGYGVACAGELTVYTALEADQLKAYKEAFEVSQSGNKDQLGPRFDRHRHRQAPGREGQPRRPTW